VVWWKLLWASEFKPLTGGRNMLLQRFMIHTQAAEEAEGRAAEKLARRQAPEAEAARQAAGAEAAREAPRRPELLAAAIVYSKHVVLTATPYVRIAARRGGDLASERARKALRLSFRAVVQPALDSMISAARNLERPGSDDVKLGAVACALAIGIGIAVALTT
jgi:hypothetical protein